MPRKLPPQSWQSKQRDVLLWFAAFFAAVALMAVPYKFPDLPRTIISSLFFGGGGLAIILLALLYLKKYRWPFIIGITLVIAFISWIFWPSDIFARQMPGATVQFAERIYYVPQDTDLILFQMENAEGAILSAYLSTAGLFTFSVKDVAKSTYDLEAKLYHTEVPVDEMAIITCEVAEDTNTTVLRIAVNDREIIRRTINDAVDLGNWTKSNLRSARIGGGQGYRLAGWGMWPYAISTNEMLQHVDALKPKLTPPGH
jgi:hypothetical protein